MWLTAVCVHGNEADQYASCRRVGAYSVLRIQFFVLNVSVHAEYLWPFALKSVTPCCKRFDPVGVLLIPYLTTSRTVCTAIRPSLVIQVCPPCFQEEARFRSIGSLFRSGFRYHGKDPGVFSSSEQSHQSEPQHLIPNSSWLILAQIETLAQS